MSKNDHDAALEALMRWFRSQEIEPAEACWLAATMCGLLAPDDKRLGMLAARMRKVRKLIDA